MSPDEIKAVLDDHGPYMTYAQAARLLACSVRTLKRETAAGRLPCYQVGRGRTLRLRTADVCALVARVG